MSDQGLNSGGRHIYQSAKLVDGTGIVLTVAAAGTPVVLKGAAFASEAVDASAGLGFVVADGNVVVDGDKGGAGVYLVEASITDAIGANSAIVLAGIYKTPSGGSAAAVGNTLRSVMPSTAARTNLGVAKAIVSLADGDKIDLRVDSNTNGDTVTVRNAHLSLVKIG